MGSPGWSPMVTGTVIAVAVAISVSVTIYMTRDPPQPTWSDACDELGKEAENYIVQGRFELPEHLLARAKAIYEAGDVCGLMYMQKPTRERALGW